MVEVNITLSYNYTTGMNTTEFKRRSDDYNFGDLGKVLKMEGRYSPFIFENDYRKSDNYLQNVSNCIVLDFDDGYTREEFKKNANFAYAIGTTKSHMKEKNGVTCDRFRVIIPTETAIDLNSEQYSNMMREVFEKFPQADKACKDTARAYSGYTGAEVEIVAGELFDWEIFYKIHIEKMEIMKRWQDKERQRTIEKGFENEGTKADWYRENWLNDSMRNKLGVDEKFVSGNRNNSLWSCAKYLKEIDLTDSEVVEAVEWINNCELDHFEIKQILKSAKIRL